MDSVLTSKDIEDFWIRVYLGANKDLIESAIDRAYLDFNRTLHGVAKLKTAESSTRLKDVVRNIVTLAMEKKFTSQHEFDEWHESCCDYLIDACKEATTHNMFYGQTQKWINMSFKYMFALGKQRLPGIDLNYQYFHVPIDNIIQKILKLENIKPFKISWSRINSYENYLDYQKQIRLKFSNRIPLDVEFLLFNKSK